MSFANKWLRHLEDQGRTVVTLEKRGKVPEYTPYTTVENVFGVKTIQQHVVYDRGMKVSNKVGVSPVNVNEVVVGTNGGLTFFVKKNKTIKVNHMESLSDEEKEAMKKEAEDCGYSVTEFMKYL